MTSAQPSPFDSSRVGFMTSFTDRVRSVPRRVGSAAPLRKSAVIAEWRRER